MSNARKIPGFSFLKKCPIGKIRQSAFNPPLACFLCCMYVQYIRKTSLSWVIIVRGGIFKVKASSCLSAGWCKVHCESLMVLKWHSFPAGAMQSISNRWILSSKISDSQPSQPMQTSFCPVHLFPNLAISAKKPLESKSPAFGNGLCFSRDLIFAVFSSGESRGQLFS